MLDRLRNGEGRGLERQALGRTRRPADPYEDRLGKGWIWCTQNFQAIFDGLTGTDGFSQNASWRIRYASWGSAH